MSSKPLTFAFFALLSIVAISFLKALAALTICGLVVLPGNSISSATKTPKSFFDFPNSLAR